jgi:hypothetical protein
LKLIVAPAAVAMVAPFDAARNEAQSFVASLHASLAAASDDRQYSFSQQPGAAPIRPQRQPAGCVSGRLHPVGEREGLP